MSLCLQPIRRSNQLNRLRLVSCYNITSNGLVQAVKKLPLLEEFQLFKTSITAKDIEVVGNSCPLLKSFKLNYGGSRSSVEYDEEAHAIATSMTGLRHLQLFANNMTNDGLKAILDGCSHLESLDLRRCFNVSLGGSLGKRCSEQIKDLRQPHDSTEDYEFDVEIYDCDSYDEEYPSGFSDIDFLLDDGAEYYEFSGGSDISGGSDVSEYEGFFT